MKKLKTWQFYTVALTIALLSSLYFMSCKKEVNEMQNTIATTEETLVKEQGDFQKEISLQTKDGQNNMTILVSSDDKQFIDAINSDYFYLLAVASENETEINTAIKSTEPTVGNTNLIPQSTVHFTTINEKKATGIKTLVLTTKSVAQNNLQATNRTAVDWWYHNNNGCPGVNRYRNTYLYCGAYFYRESLKYGSCWPYWSNLTLNNWQIGGLWILTNSYYCKNLSVHVTNVNLSYPISCYYAN